MSDYSIEELNIDFSHERMQYYFQINTRSVVVRGSSFMEYL